MKPVALACLLVVLTAASAARQQQRSTSVDVARVTFTETIAPILHAQCVSCHRAGEAAPFPLISYEDAAKRGALIEKVTRSRYMPPWRAVHGFGEFKDERRLSDEQIAAIGAWVAAGMPRGNPARMPTPPPFTDGWQLGTPDLILEMPAGYRVPADGPDVYRNFVLPTRLTEDKWVRAIEFRPAARRVVHHALVSFVRGGALAELDDRSDEPGFEGAMPVALVPGFQPAGELGTWAVGTTPRSLPEGLARPLAKGSDLVLQLHFHPSGRAETERSRIGLYFTGTPPERRLRTPGIPGFFGLLAGIDIPPGERAYTIRGSLPLSADMRVIAISAHAHYLGKEIKAVATLPDGSTKPLLWIRDWDFNWQDRYDYKEPVLLPKGSQVEATITYDNSADNPRNPCNPPRRVTWGMQSLDEMGSINLLMVAAHAEDEQRLTREGAAMIRAAVAQVRDSEVIRRYLAEQRRFMDAARGSAMACGGQPADR